MELGEIIIYQPGIDNIQIDVRVEDETVWLTQYQMVELFNTTKQNISLHINNLFKEGELNKESVVKENLTTAADGKRYNTAFYNLDVIISVGYRVKSNRGTQFRIWATNVLKQYLLKGYALHSRIEMIEHKVLKHEQKIDLLIKSGLPQTEGIFYDGQVFDAFTFISDIVRSAHEKIILIDNFVDDKVLFLLSKRTLGVNATIYTNSISKQLEHDLMIHNKQYPAIDIIVYTKSHDRFLIIDNSFLYHIGASLKDLGKNMVCFFKNEFRC